jgi:hypothetical protein
VAVTDRTTAEKSDLDTRKLRSDAHNTVVATVFPALSAHPGR